MARMLIAGTCYHPNPAQPLMCTGCGVHRIGHGDNYEMVLDVESGKVLDVYRTGCGPTTPEGTPRLCDRSKDYQPPSQPPGEAPAKAPRAPRKKPAAKPKARTKSARGAKAKARR